MKYTITLLDHTERMLAERVREQQDLAVSLLLAELLDRYQFLVEWSAPRLHLPEWLLLCDVLNGVISTPASMSALALAADVQEAIEDDQLDDKWGVDGEAFVARLQQCSPAESIAVIDIAERFWRTLAKQGEVKPDQIELLRRLVPRGALLE